MSGTTISTFVGHTVLLGGSRALGPMIITATGGIIPYADADGTGEGMVGVLATSAGVTLINHGFVDGTSVHSSTGVDFRSGGDTLINTGVISGGQALYAQPGQVGTYGVEIDNGMVRNEATGVISGGPGGEYRDGTGGQASTGIVMTGTSTLLNAGAIKGGLGDQASIGGVGGTGAVLDGGFIANRGTITGGQGGYGYNGAGQGGNGGTGLVINGGTVRDLGTISGGAAGLGSGGGSGLAGAAVQFGSAASVLDIGAGAVFHGIVAANSADVLGLVGSGGTLTGIGSEFTGFGRIDERAGSTWTITGAANLGAGALVARGSLTLLGDVSGSGRLALDAGATVDVQGKLSLATLQFRSDGNETLVLSTAGTISSRLLGFGHGDTIDIKGVVTSLSFAGGTLTLQGSGFTHDLTLGGHYATADFARSSDGNGGTDITYGGSAAHAILADIVHDWMTRPV